MTDTWFMVMEMNDGSGFFVLRADRETLPKAVVVSGPYQSQADAQAIATEMETAGHA